MIYCKQCGQVIEDSSLKKCPKCNTTIGKGGRFCADCGKKLNPGEKCDCSTKSEKGANNDVKNTEKCANNSVIPSGKCENEVKSTTVEQKPAVNRRIAGNPLFEKIAQGDSDTEKSNEILQAEAIKIVYGKDMTVKKLKEQKKAEELAKQKELEEQQNREAEIQKQEEEKKKEEARKAEQTNAPQRNVQSTIPVSPPTNQGSYNPGNVNFANNNRNFYGQNVAMPNNKTQGNNQNNFVGSHKTNTPVVNGQQQVIPQPVKQNNNPMGSFSNNVQSNIVNNPQDNKQDNRQVINNTNNNPNINNNISTNVQNPNIQNGNFNTVPVEDAKQVFPNAFGQENMQYANKPYNDMQHGPTSGPPKKIGNFSEKNFDGMWVAGLISAIASLFIYDKTLYYICISIAFVFGLIDILLNKKKTGVGVVLGSIVIMIMTMLQNNGGV